MFSSAKDKNYNGWSSAITAESTQFYDKRTSPEKPTPNDIKSNIDFTKQKTDEWLAKQRKVGKVVGFFKIYPTKRQLEEREDETVPKPNEKFVKKKIQSIMNAIKLLNREDIRITQREGLGFDGKPIFYKLIYVAWTMSLEDIEEFKWCPYEIRQEEKFKGHEWESIIQLKCYDIDLKKNNTAKCTGGFKKPPVIDPLVDVRNNSDGLPNNFDPDMRMPRCYGKFWNLPPAGPRGKGLRCAKSGKSRDGNDKGPCQWNLKIWNELKNGKKQSSSWCQYNHYTIRDAGIVDKETYEIFKKKWLEDSKKMLEYTIEKEKQIDIKAESMIPDNNGFYKKLSGRKAGNIDNAEKPKENLQKNKSPFSYLQVFGSDSDSDSDSEKIKNEVVVAEKSVEKVVEKPKEEPEKKVNRGKKEKKSRGVPFIWENYE